MGTFIYNPDVKILIKTRSGTIDVSKDIVSGRVSLRSNAPHHLSFTLTNFKRKYDGVFAPNDRIVVRLKRIKWVQVMAGYVNQVPFASVWPREVNIVASCTLKKIVKRLYDPGAEATVNLLNQFTTPDGSSSGEDVMKDRLLALLVDIAEWDKDKIHISKIPPGWMNSIRDLYERVSPLIKSPDDILSEVQQLLPGGSFAGDGAAIGTGTGTAPGASGGNYTREELMDLARWAGIQDAPLAAAIALAESGGNPNASNRNSNGSIDRGLWQINSVHGALSTFDPTANARAMFTISKGGTDWTPWVVYKTGAYRQHMGPDNAGARGGTAGSSSPAADPALPSSQAASARPVFPIAGGAIGSPYHAPRDGGARLHKGVDIGAPIGTPILAVKSGVITLARKGGGGAGFMMDLRASSGETLRHMHITPNGFLKSVGQTVRAGEAIARVGGTGSSGRDTDFSPHLHFEVFPPGAPTQTPNQVDPAPYLAGAVQMAGSDADDFGIGGGDLLNAMIANLQHSTASRMLTGARVLMNDVPLFGAVRDLFGAMMRHFCSGPNGDIIAWFPDYFDNFGQAGTMTIEPIELNDFTMNWDDDGVVTHQFVTGSVLGYGGLQAGVEETLVKMVETMGVASVEFPELMMAVIGNIEGWSDPEEILKRLGARVDVHHAPAITTPEGEFFLAVHLFAQAWAGQFYTEVPISFMPEVYPGMLLKIPHVGLQVYVKGVTHSWSMTDGGGFDTTVEVMAPSSLDGSLFGLPRSGGLNGVRGDSPGIGWAERTMARLPF